MTLLQKGNRKRRYSQSSDDETSQDSSIGSGEVSNDDHNVNNDNSACSGDSDNHSNIHKVSTTNTTVTTEISPISTETVADTQSYNIQATENQPYVHYNPPKNLATSSSATTPSATAKSLNDNPTINLTSSPSTTTSTSPQNKIPSINNIIHNNNDPLTSPSIPNPIPNILSPTFEQRLPITEQMTNTSISTPSKRSELINTTSSSLYEQPQPPSSPYDMSSPISSKTTTTPPRQSNISMLLNNNNTDYHSSAKSTSTATIFSNASAISASNLDTLECVADVWNEWMSGIDGYPSIIKSLETYDMRWANDNKETLLSRKKIVKELQDRSRSGSVGIDQAIRELEVMRNVNTRSNRTNKKSK
ncbi:15304_t:CDS:2 [Entrophospora sp. SA101]|nr:15304_t:CDS:2 [Entrophospora sp. SA101]